MNSSTHPLIDGMRRAGSINRFFDLPIRDPHQEGWISATVTGETFFTPHGGKSLFSVREWEDEEGR